MNEARKYKLIIFDADGTLIDRDTGVFLPGVAKWLATSGRNYHLAIATNQGGPACRDAGWGDKYPSLERIEIKYGGLAEVIGAKLFVSLCYPARQGVIVPLGVFPSDPRISRSWRKPEPGMLVAAMAHYDVTPAETLMVGDRPEDFGAAAMAKVGFRWASEFFGGA